MIGGSIRQLKVSLGNLIILVQDDSHVALIGRENNDVGDGVARAKADFSNLERGGGSLQINFLVEVGFLYFISTVRYQEIQVAFVPLYHLDVISVCLWL